MKQNIFIMSRNPIIKFVPINALGKQTRNKQSKNKYNLVSPHGVKPFGVESPDVK